ncbi:tyrosine-type recombinase/integrase [Vibrio sp. CJQ_6]|uniref:tyrosine-type recombinase/integrase n=1 Tax=Vibrio sp. CJQ_6 TaxID=3367165 RepID=UPI00370B8994
MGRNGRVKGRFHVLRHMFASHLMMKGSNIITLQKILGFSRCGGNKKPAVRRVLINCR